MMLIEHDAIEADLFDELVIDNTLLVEARTFSRIEVLIGEEQRGISKFASFLFRIDRHRLLSEIHKVHGDNPPPRPDTHRNAKSLTSLASSAGFSTSRKWPAPEIVSRRAPGIASRYCSP